MRESTALEDGTAASVAEVSFIPCADGSAGPASSVGSAGPNRIAAARTDYRSRVPAGVSEPLRPVLVFAMSAFRPRQREVVKAKVLLHRIDLTNPLVRGCADLVRRNVPGSNQDIAARLRTPLERRSGDMSTAEEHWCGLSCGSVSATRLAAAVNPSSRKVNPSHGPGASRRLLRSCRRGNLAY
jgi:hypothetical protein